MATVPKQSLSHMGKVTDEYSPGSPKIYQHNTTIDPSKEAAAAKLWAVYVSEAEKYDKSLVKSWRSDMEGMLIFVGFSGRVGSKPMSASLTAFIVKRYKTLVPDSRDSTVRLLNQISQQLTAAAGSTFHVPALPPFAPLATSPVCITLWFISLGLSMTYALAATLLEQWAHNLLHKADMRSSPVICTHIFSYLYYGLVAFLVPINLPIAIVSAAVLASVTTVYSTITLLPLWHLNCPYHTPFSIAFWHISQGLATLRHLRRVSAADSSESASDLAPIKTMVGAMSQCAMEVSVEGMARDYRALVWTVKSLVGDTKLELFVEAIPNVLWGPNGRRQTYQHQIQSLMHNPDLGLPARMGSLLCNCESGLLTPEVAKRW
ncbi:hypothetical protein DFH07DRAFT_766518 [Mycena maculata]|uniref:DUF6535 domain-containing protein n=1 Tax=Mycena maculata TaxID=230809 RepID=A0AAD7K4Z9_9AGAR|nr:hypothetical protein DFH07DRAFT_766518 [Mycena maculata]